jgi:hypothetical protein
MTDEYTCQDLAGKTTALPAIDAVQVTETWTEDALDGGTPKGDRLAWLLRGWRAEVDREPYPELVSVDDAVAIVLAAKTQARRGRRRLWVMPAAAAAGLLVLLAGTAVGSYSATPNDPLWPITQTIYGEHSKSVAAAHRVELRLAAAKQALATGRTHDAEAELDAAEPDLRAVRPSDGLAQLADVHDFLEAKAAETPDGTPVDPGTPLATDPSRPVPLGAQLGAPVLLQVAQAPLVSVPGLPSPITAGPTAGVPAAATAAPAPAPGGYLPPAPVTVVARSSSSGAGSDSPSSTSEPVPIESAQATGGGPVEVVVTTSTPTSSTPAPPPPIDDGRTDLSTTAPVITTTIAPPPPPDPATIVPTTIEATPTTPEAPIAETTEVAPTTTAPPTTEVDGAEQEERVSELPDAAAETATTAIEAQSTAGDGSSGGQNDPPRDPAGNDSASARTETTQPSSATTSDAEASTGG